MNDIDSTRPDQERPLPSSGRQRGPTDIADRLVREEAKKAFVWLGIAGAIVLVVVLAEPLLVIFGGVVCAALIEGGQRLLARVLPAPRSVRIALVLLAAVGFVGWFVQFAGQQIAAQAAAMPGLVEAQAARVMAYAAHQGIAFGHPDPAKLAEQALGGVGPVTQALGGLLGGVTTLLLILILGIYLAIEPALYRRGVAWLLPVDQRDYFRVTLDVMGTGLRRLLLGRLIGMVSEGLITGIALSLGGVPMATLLGLLTGMLAFLPNIGAPISGSLMILVGFSGGSSMGLYCVAVYLAVHLIDGNVIVPMVARKTADLAPAVVLGAQLIFGVLFGVLGLALADPVVAMLKIALERQAARPQNDDSPSDDFAAVGSEADS